MNIIIEKLKERLNLTVVFQLILAVFTPILAYAGITAESLTSWKSLGDLILMALGNPYVLCLVVVSVYQTMNNPTEAMVEFANNGIKAEVENDLYEDDIDVDVVDDDEKDTAEFVYNDKDLI